MSRSPREYIRHILEEIDYILSQLPGQDFHSFSQNPTLKRAFVRSLEIIGGVSLQPGGPQSSLPFGPARQRHAAAVNARPGPQHVT